MLLKCISFLVVGVSQFCFSAIAAAQDNPACELPKDLQQQIASKYGRAKLVNLSDLDEYDRGLFQKEHADACPGLIKVDFYSDGKPTWALVLNRKAGSTEHTELIVAHYVGNRWRINLLGTGSPSPNAPVVWSQDPGEYHDIYGKKTIRARDPVIVFCKYESWAILYAWTDNRVSKIWLSD